MADHVNRISQSVQCLLAFPSSIYLIIFLSSCNRVAFVRVVYIYYCNKVNGEQVHTSLVNKTPFRCHIIVHFHTLALSIPTRS